MEIISFTRRELHDKVWSGRWQEICEQLDVELNGLQSICDRLNVPFPDRGYWKKLLDGKKVAQVPLPDKSKGTERVSFFERNVTKAHAEQVAALQSLFEKMNLDRTSLNDLSLDKLVQSTQAGLQKDWRSRSEFWEKSKMLDIHVAHETLPRALRFMDLFIKVLRAAGHNIRIDVHRMYAVVEGEEIQISLQERNRRVEYIDEFNHHTKSSHPTGALYLKREGIPYESKGWSDGPKKGNVEEQIPVIVTDLVTIAREEKDRKERYRIAEEERQQKAKMERELHERQEDELLKFKRLLFDTHRFQTALSMRNYIDAIESKAGTAEKLTEELTQWLAWAKKRADWYDPTVPRDENDLLKSVDILNLQSRDSYSGFGFTTNYGEKEKNFWKPWYLK